MKRALALPALLAIVLAAGCIQVKVDPVPSSTSETSGAPGAYPVACLLVDENRTPLRSGTCTYRFGLYGATVAVDGNGSALRSVPAGLTGTLAGSAPGRAARQASFTVDGPKNVRIALPRAGAGGAGSAASGPTTGPGGIPTAADGGDLPPGNVTLTPRHWQSAFAVVGDGSGGEPQVAVAPDGTIYYSPLSSVYASTDGGGSFRDVTPDPPLGATSDTAIQVAPDGTVWFAEDWPYAGQTQGCGSTDRGNTWTCDRLAIPGATDRMWIAGRSSTEAYVMTNEGLEYHTFAKTTNGGARFTAYALEVLDSTTRNGNMAYDEAHGAVWEVESSDGVVRLLRVDTPGPLIPKVDTPVPAPYSLPWLAISDGVFWTTGERDGRILVGRSLDQGKTWAQFPVSVEPRQATFSYVAAGPNGRAAVVYYGSDKPGDPTSNGGHWSLYVAETDDALSPEPTWVETKLVPDIHDGNLCIGLNCEQSGGDLEARFAGDLIGIAMDADGNAHVAYVRDDGSGFPNEYRRQVKD